MPEKPELHLVESKNCDYRRSSCRTKNVKPESCAQTSHLDGPRKNKKNIYKLWPVIQIFDEKRLLRGVFDSYNEDKSKRLLTNSSTPHEQANQLGLGSVLLLL